MKKLKIKWGSEEPLSKAKQLREWKSRRKDVNDNAEMFQTMVDDIDKALRPEKLTELVELINKIRIMSKKNKKILVKELKTTKDMIRRLKMLGEISDPYYKRKKQGKYIELL
jgi:Asp-tRNA(Asn)/Glu-tRNA(Gln) amidotransferase B subunit